MIAAQTHERLFGEILSHIPTGIITVDDKLRVVSANERFAPLHNLGKDVEIVNSDIAKLLPLDSSAYRLLGKLLEGDIEKVETVYRLTGKRDSPVLKMVATLLKDKEGVTKGIVMLCEDITEMKNLEQQLIQSSKMAAIGEMAAMFVHEMRNPITGIFLATEVLKIKCGHDESMMDTVSDIEVTVKRIDSVVNKIIDFAQLDMVSFSKSSIEDSLNSSLEFISGYMKKYKVTHKVRVVSDLPSMYLDKTQLVQVFINLIKNASKAMEPKGGGELGIVLDRRDDLVRISFTDQGMGMDEDEMQQAFRPFYSNFNEGAGLGLSIAQRIVELHRGKILMESKPDQGSTFTVELPVRIKSE